MSAFRKALLVEDEQNLAVALKIALRKLEIPAEHVTTLRGAEDSLRAASPESGFDLIVLDRQLPDGEGLDLCSRLRAEGYAGMILVLTARSEIDDKVSGLDLGADDYMGKPFSWEEFEARIRALSRRQPQKHIPAPVWELDPERLRVRGPAGWVELTPLEFKLASKLIHARGSIVSRENLLKDVWGFTLLPKTRTVDHFLGRLRKRFEDNPEEPRHFLTVRGAGYRFQP